jgi:hydroxyacylglutathione hydrolase
MGEVVVIRELSDNFAYLYIIDDGRAVVVDPAEAGPILKEAEKRELQIEAVLITHGHWDHSAGADEIQKKTNCKIVRPGRERKDGEILQFGQAKIQVIQTPGHTADGVCYYVEPSADEKGSVFTGDTLFIAGCGTPIGGDMEGLRRSIEKLARLPEETAVYPGHDYTEDNYNFALTIEPGNTEIQSSYAKATEDRLTGGEAAVPSSIGKEKKTNVFMRAGCEAIKKAVNMTGAGNAEVFAEIRRRKNRYG